MKICIVTHTFPKHQQDTTAAFMDPLVRGIIAAGNDVTVLAPYHKEFIPDDFSYRIITYKYIWPVSLHRLGFSQTLKDGMRLGWDVYILSPLLYFFGTLALWRLLRREHFNIVSSHWILPNGFLAFIATIGMRIPYVISLPGSDVYVAQKHALFRLMASYSVAHSSALSADSAQYLEELRKITTINVPEQIIPYPINADVMKRNLNGVSTLRKKIRATNKTVVILGVGRMIYKKGFDYLIRAVSLAYTRYKNIKLILVGKGDQMEEWKLLADQIGIGHIVSFVGLVPRDKLIIYYNACDIFVMPSIVDQLGNIDDRPVALLEAMACGAAIIATNFLGNASTIENNKSGMLVPQKNVPAIAHALDRLISSPRLRRQLGKEASRFVRQKLNMYAVGKQYMKIFEKINKQYEHI